MLTFCSHKSSNAIVISSDPNLGPRLWNRSRPMLVQHGQCCRLRVWVCTALVNICRGFEQHLVQQHWWVCQLSVCINVDEAHWMPIMQPSCYLISFFVLSIKCFPTDPWSRSWCSQELRDQWVPSSQLTTWQASPFWHQVPAIWSWWLQLIIKVIYS